MVIKVYTDGACKKNPGKGGWGVYIENNDKTVIELCGGEEKTTNNRMEMMAVYRALKVLDATTGPIIVYTDSKYVFLGITEWVHKWRLNGWQTSSKGNVLNKDLWKMIDSLIRENIKFEWVKGHNGCLGNEKADELANRGVNNKN